MSSRLQERLEAENVTSVTNNVPGQESAIEKYCVPVDLRMYGADFEEALRSLREIHDPLIEEKTDDGKVPAHLRINGSGDHSFLFIPGNVIYENETKQDLIAEVLQELEDRTASIEKARLKLEILTGIPLEESDYSDRSIILLDEIRSPPGVLAGLDEYARSINEALDGNFLEVKSVENNQNRLVIKVDNVGAFADAVEKYKLQDLVNLEDVIYDRKELAKELSTRREDANMTWLQRLVRDVIRAIPDSLPSSVRGWLEGGSETSAFKGGGQPRRLAEGGDQDNKPAELKETMADKPPGPYAQEELNRRSGDRSGTGPGAGR